MSFHRMHEFNLQFEAASALREAGVPFQLELSTPAGRLDIAVCNETSIFGIIECKTTRKDRSGSFQIARYKSIGVPVLVIDPGTALVDVVREAKRWIEAPGVIISSLASAPGILRKQRRPRSRIKRLLLDQDEDLNLRH